MKICHFLKSTPFGKQNRLGILVGGSLHEILDVNLFWVNSFRRRGFFNPLERAHHHAPPSLSAVLKLKENPLSFFQNTREQFHKEEKEERSEDSPSLFRLEDSKLGPPLDVITTYRDFYAHEKHVAKGFELRKEPIPKYWYEIPAYYKGSPHGFIGHEDEILWPSYSRILDYELELAAIVGRDGFNLSAKKACDHLFGFTILNDISARDMQKKEMAVRLGPAKAKDFCSVIGPVIATIDEFKTDRPDLTMVARINGEEWSKGQSGDAHYGFSEMMAHVSRDEWLLAGDLLGSGTVGTGCGLELSRWIQPGDEIELEVEGIGILRNRVGHPQQTKPGQGD
ncbi:MAG: fumarylacetoacetate hydrolase family protein [Bacteriovoracales bacterium]|nr:fumarylacetoacetate hydrolase family protein [Bacteriovoracales bacterium]